MPTPFPSIPSPTTLLLSLLAMAFGTGGCDFQRTVDVEPPGHEPKLVLNGEIASGSYWRLDVSQSLGAFEPGSPSDSTLTVTDATVSVFEEGNRQGQLRLDSLNQYSTRQFVPEPGRQYTVRVSAPDLGTAEATDRVPPVPPMRLETEKTSGLVPNDYNRALQLTIDDPPNTDNYYHIRLQKNGYFRDGTSIDTTGVTDMRFQTRNRPILDEMEQVLENNGQYYYGRDATFTDVLFGGTRHTLRLLVGDGQGIYSNPEEGDGYPRVEYILYVSVLSEDAYQFDRTKRIFEQADGNPFAEPVDIHSNVEGGYGVVAGRHTDTLRAEVTLE
jgi:hypothetical protein